MKPCQPRDWGTLRAWLLQLLVLAGIIWLIAGIASTTLVNLDRLGVQSGFDFLDKRAGFDINQTLFEYSSDSPVYMAFAIAICNTLLLALLSIALSTLIGLVVALCRISGDRFFNALGHMFIETFRNIPALLQVFFWYYVVLRSLPTSAQSWQWGERVFLNNRGLFLPGLNWVISTTQLVWGLLLFSVLVVAVGMKFYRRRHSAKSSGSLLWKRLAGIAWLLAVLAWLMSTTQWTNPELQKFGYVSGWVITPELGALILGLSLYNASSVAEVIRAGFIAVPKGQWEAARSLGLSSASIMRRVVVPQAMRIIIPPMTTVYLNIFKATSLGAAVGYPEIVSVMVGTTNNIVGRPVEIMFLTFSVYSLVSLVGIWLMGHVNRHYNRFDLL
ncbi:MAG: ABC transporter permease subunit [Xanthomonadales bacterium]|nr:ABC transporter permease subunit [Xanthomonadales bacterium]